MVFTLIIQFTAASLVLFSLLAQVLLLPPLFSKSGSSTIVESASVSNSGLISSSISIKSSCSCLVK